MESLLRRVAESMMMDIGHKVHIVSMTTLPNEPNVATEVRLRSAVSVGEVE